ncbi:MAG: hypothetical protein ACYT04_50260 [Nostoc sp.]
MSAILHITFLKNCPLILTPESFEVICPVPHILNNTNFIENIYYKSIAFVLQKARFFPVALQNTTENYKLALINFERLLKNSVVNHFTPE